MTMTDPLADMITRIRNAISANHNTVDVMWSNMHMSVAEILRDEGYVSGLTKVEDGPGATIRIQLKYGPRQTPVITSIQRVSRPGRRVYASVDKIPRVMGGLGVAIMSTPMGVMTGKQAAKQRVGGEVLIVVA